MKKLIIKNPNTKDIYEKKFNLVCSYIQKYYKNEVAFGNLNSLNKIQLEKYDVIISNYIPEYLINRMNKSKVVTIIFNDYIKFHNKCDICIDPIQTSNNISPMNANFKISKNYIIALIKVFNLIEILEWDSQFWGFKIAFISTRHLTNNIIFTGF